MQIFLQILPVFTSDIELRSVQASTKHTENLINNFKLFNISINVGIQLVVKSFFKIKQSIISLSEL